MENIGVIALATELLALCGIVSIRCFMPTFLVCIVCRLGPQYGWCPAALEQLAHQIPGAMLTNGALAVLAVMAALELAANWNATARGFFADANWEQYTKPFYAFVMALVLGSPEAASVAPGVGEAVAQGMTPSVATNVVAQVASNDAAASAAGAGLGAWTWALFSASLAAFGTMMLCTFRKNAADVIRSLDPDDSFKLQTFACVVEETTWLAVLIVALLVPLLAILLMGVAGGCGWTFLRLLRKIENHNSHDCPHCADRVHDSAVKCPRCGTEQPLPYHAVGFRGLASHMTVDVKDATAVRAHHSGLLMEHRCPICAAPLKDKLVCGHCGTRVWEQGVSREEILKTLDFRMCAGVAGGVLASTIPVIGFVVTVVYLNWCVLRIIRSYETRSGRSFSRLLFRFLKWSALIVCVLFSGIPFVGILFLMPYVLSYWYNRSRFLK